MDVSSDRGKLHDRLKDLRARWEQVQEDWDDPVRRDFEETHWAEMEECVRAALRAMDQLASVLRQARNECS